MSLLSSASTGSSERAARAATISCSSVVPRMFSGCVALPPIAMTSRSGRGSILAIIAACRYNFPNAAGLFAPDFHRAADHKLMSIQNLLSGVPSVVNIGLSGFAADLAAQGTPVVQVDWRPPAQGKKQFVDLLSSLSAFDARIAKANDEALKKMLAGNPVLLDVRPAGEVIKGLGDKVLLHSGPPITWERMCGPMQGAVAGAIVFEGWAKDLES